MAVVSVESASNGVETIAQQRLMWEAVKKKINGLIGKLNASNVKDVAEEILTEDLIWGRGLFCSAILRYSPDSEPVFAALVAVINSEFPDVGYLLLKRILNQFKIALNQKEHRSRLLPLSNLLAQLVNQGVVRRPIAIEIVFLLLQDCAPGFFNIKIATGFIEQCGSVVCAGNPRGLDSVFDRFQEIIDYNEGEEGDLDADVVSLIEKLLHGMIRRRSWELSAGYSVLPPELDIVEVDDQVTHEISVLNDLDPEMCLDQFISDPRFVNWL